VTLQVRLTVPVNPPDGVMFIVVLPELFLGTVIVAGAALSLKEPVPPPPAILAAL